MLEKQMDATMGNQHGNLLFNSIKKQKKRVKQEGPSETIIRDTLSKKSIWYSPDYNTNIVCGLGNQVW